MAGTSALRRAEGKAKVARGAILNAKLARAESRETSSEYSGGTDEV
jgi:hypothetical protein